MLAIAISAVAVPISLQDLTRRSRPSGEALVIAAIAVGLAFLFIRVMLDPEADVLDVVPMAAGVGIGGFVVFAAGTAAIVPEQRTGAPSRYDRANPNATAERRLLELEELRHAGLVTEDEYLAKRGDILQDL